MKKAAKGQVIVIFTLAIFALLAMAALILDGGQTYLHRRDAQAAADAGALAGAHEMCAGAGAGAAPATAIHYATVQNSAASATAWIDNGEIFVQAIVPQTSFFAQLFGIHHVDVPALASAGCYHPGIANHILPVAWSCRPPLVGGGSSSQDCEEDALDWPNQLKPMITGSPSTVTVDGSPIHTPYDFDHDYLTHRIYVIMDAATTASEACQPIGTVNCDIDGDGFPDLLGSGDRSWLDLNGGGGGASSLVDWIHYGYNAGIAVHTWLAGQDGVAQSVFDAVYDYQRRNIVVVPVFNYICTGDPATHPLCQTNAHLPPFELAPGHTDTIVYTSSASQTYYHVIGFAIFYITCIDSGPHGPCPGHKAAVTIGGLKNSVKTIEGYFVTNYPVGDLFSGSGGADLGEHIISLTR